ncbi:hypothetical protein [Mucilaginibacter auburnensis]|uniref:Lipoprotein n=1 Tax=Mucilaginibacter auburnensis TaxID=1457233 RepID=A0A2H9VUY2_9SPHI|nr:hypothetical protein [Mucilaginibacter auburnensis]PJJ84626.1 hypothetical protein CLV57_1640 [Mucilaginibacter auburnensis]
MKKLTLLMLCTTLLSCSSTQKIKKGLTENDIYVDRNFEKKEFLSMFKTSVFVKSMQYAFNNSPEIKKLLREDMSVATFGESIDFDDVNAAATIIVAKIKRDSALNIERLPEDVAGKKVFKNCLDFYNSKQLNDIAKKLYKEKYSKPDVMHITPDSLSK